jgi:hypothetical protein
MEMKRNELIATLKQAAAFVQDNLAEDAEQDHELHHALFTALADLERPPDSSVRYEGLFDEPRDLCYVQVHRPGYGVYPLQERQDLVNHSPTGLSWGYVGSGPAQTALAILADYLRDDDAAQELHSYFSQQFVCRLPKDKPWHLTGREIDMALRKIHADLKAQRAQWDQVRVTAAAVANGLFKKGDETK